MVNNVETGDKNKNCCRNCKYLSEDWCSGTGALFCSHPKGPFFDDDFVFDNETLDLEDCDFFEAKEDNNENL